MLLSNACSAFTRLTKIAGTAKTRYSVAQKININPPSNKNDPNPWLAILSAPATIVTGIINITKPTATKIASRIKSTKDRSQRATNARTPAASFRIGRAIISR
jgi:hypothetical protein